MIQGVYYPGEVLVLRTDDMPRLKAFFEKLGLSFVAENHPGPCPPHFACQVGETVLEIYPPRNGP
jgi:hypothetical protein